LKPLAFRGSMNLRRVNKVNSLVKEFIEEIDGKADFSGDPAFPIVYGRLDRDYPKTLIIYGMYDVQPAEEKKWISPSRDFWTSSCSSQPSSIAYPVVWVRTWVRKKVI
jgi:acetylornithine deacetylase/succinyl-diaminopimelate desuccinylase-like protein